MRRSRAVFAFLLFFFLAVANTMDDIGWGGLLCGAEGVASYLTEM